MNSPGSEKRLKRGLEDLSPLFQFPVSRPFEVQFVSICVPDQERATSLATTTVASDLVHQTGLFAFLVSIAPGVNIFPAKSRERLPSLELLDSRISRVSLSHQQLWNLTRNGLNASGSSSVSRFPGGNRGVLVFLEFEPSRFQTLGRIALLLDRVVLFPEPRVESLREAYRWTKILWNLNREIEFFLLFRSPDLSESLGEFLFERFSLTTSRFLGTAAGWLGSLALSPPADRLHPEPLLAAEGLKRPLAPEKSRFWQALQKRFQGNSFRGLVEPPLEEISLFANRLSREELREFIQFELDTASSKGWKT